MKAWMQLIRLPNVLTAISDVLAGVAIACFLTQSSLPDIELLSKISLASMFLYMGGIVFNDVFDVQLDKIERPDRPIPSGKISVMSASMLATVAFTVGCILAYSVSIQCLYIALGIVLMCLLYNGKAKHHYILGPLTMGGCRGLNLLLGVAVIATIATWWYVALVPIVYIAAVTNISRGEVYGNNKHALRVSLVLYTIVVVTLVYITLKSQHYFALIYIFFFIWMIFHPLIKALQSLEPEDIKKSVKFGVLALILMNASWVAISGFWLLALFLIATLPITIILAKKYSVT